MALGNEGAKPVIVPWLKPQYLHYRHTSFDQTEEGRAESFRQRRDELRADGFDV